MNKWKPPENWTIVTCMMMICARHQNTTIITAVQCSLKTMKTIRRKMEICNRDQKDRPCRKEHSRCSDCLHTPEFIHQLQKKVIEDTGKEMPALVQEISVAFATINLDLNKDICYQSYKKCNSQLLTKKGLRKQSGNGKETPEQGETSC